MLEHLDLDRPLPIDNWHGFVNAMNKLVWLPENMESQLLLLYGKPQKYMLVVG